MFRLGSVKAKLTALVAFSAVATLTSLPVLSWMMHRQLVDEVDDRVPEAVRGFELELSDDLRDLQATTRQLAGDPRVVDAVGKSDRSSAERAAKTFHDAYPDIDIAFYDASGALVASVGVTEPIARASDVPGIAALAPDAELRVVLPHGCERGATAPPGVVLAKKSGGGTVLGCLPLDAAYFANAHEKLGVELAMVVPAGADGTAGSAVRTQAFPSGELARAGHEPAILESGPTTWALVRFAPKSLAEVSPGYEVAVALDVTDIKNIVQRNLLVSVGVLALATLLSILLGARVASVMSRALSRVNFALRKLEQQEYVHVETVKTGDELEDLATGFNSMVDGLKERDKLRTTMGKYMTEAVVDHVLKGEVELGGETLLVTVLFTDIRSFTSISEKMDAQALVKLLNEYFTEMVGIVMSEGGVVDKYIGDAIMAVFGAPVPKDDDAVRAVRAAVRMRAALDALNERLAERGAPIIRTGIGLHTGEVVAGNIGSEQRMEYTVIGDAVNLASRLEGSTKELGVDVLVSADTYERVKDVVKARAVKEITVKGREQSVMTYAVDGMVDADA